MGAACDVCESAFRLHCATAEWKAATFTNVFGFVDRVGGFGFVDRVGGFCLKVHTVCTTDKRYIHCAVYLLIRDRPP
jgi:hypothetical protein